MNGKLIAKRILALAALMLLVAGCAWLYWAHIRPAFERMGGVVGLRDWLEAHSWGGRIAFIAMMALQIVVAIIPGGPLELAAGYAFGPVEGTILCMAGILLGSALVFCLARTLGMRFVRLFFSQEKIDALPIWKNRQRLELIAFLLFLIPGTPKDMLTYAVGLTPVQLSRWLLITGIARLPSVITTAACADAVAVGDYRVAIVSLAVTAALAGVSYLIYRRAQGR